MRNDLLAFTHLAPRPLARPSFYLHAFNALMAHHGRLEVLAFCLVLPWRGASSVDPNATSAPPSGLLSGISELSDPFAPVRARQKREASTPPPHPSPLSPSPPVPPLPPDLGLSNVLPPKTFPPLAIDADETFGLHEFSAGDVHFTRSHSSHMSRSQFPYISPRQLSCFLSLTHARLSHVPHSRFPLYTFFIFCEIHRTFRHDGDTGAEAWGGGWVEDVEDRRAGRHLLTLL